MKTADILQYARIMKIDGGEGSGIKGHTTENPKAEGLLHQAIGDTGFNATARMALSNAGFRYRPETQTWHGNDAHKAAYERAEGKLGVKGEITFKPTEERTPRPVAGKDVLVGAKINELLPASQKLGGAVVSVRGIDSATRDKLANYSKTQEQHPDGMLYATPTWKVKVLND